MADPVCDTLIENNHKLPPEGNVSRERCGSSLGMPAFIVSFGTLGFISWGLYTVVVSQISTLEKAFGLSSAESGWMLTMWEIGYVVCIAISSYFAPKAHIPRALGIVTIICGISGLVCMLPHFTVFEETHILTSANSTTTSADDLLCSSNVTATASPETSSEEASRLSKKNVAYGLLCLGLALQGIGKAPCYPYSAQYVDDNANKQNTGFYISIILSISMFGLIVGYGIGSGVSKLYVTLEATELLPSDSRFIGAWWIGFLCLGVLTLLSAIPMFFFPRRMKTFNKTAQIQAHKQQALQTKPDAVKEIKVAAKTLLQIVKTPVYILTLIGTWFQLFAFATFFGFEPKYMESQFDVPAWQSNIMLGVASIASYSVGCVLGGYLTKRFKMTPFVTLRMCLLLFLSSNLVLIAMMFIGCPSRDIFTPVDESGLPIPVDCDCSQQQLLPICGEDGRNYFSPCHAGCANGTLTEFSGCSLIPGGASAVAGLCQTPCKMEWVYAVARFLANMIDATLSIPIFLVFLRSAGEDKKAFALGLSAATFSICAWLPGPVVGGKMVDSTCLIWKVAATHGLFCGHYDTDYQRRLLMGSQFGIRMFGLLFTTSAMFVARRIPDWDEENKTETAENDEQSKKALVM